MLNMFGIFICGLTLGTVSFYFYGKWKKSGFQILAQKIIAQAEMQAESIQKQTAFTQKLALIEHQKELEQITHQERKKLQQEEDRLQLREDKLENRMALVEKKLSDIEKKETLFTIRKKELEDEKKNLHTSQTKLIQDLEKLSNFTCAEAKEYVISLVQNDLKNETAKLIVRAKKEAEEEAEKEACKVIATAINRYAASYVSDATIATVSIPNEEIKGRIIGREGKNIRAFENITGITIVIDDTPGIVTLSGFDPVAKQIAKQTLTELVSDGRIYPTRIEELAEKAKNQVEKQIKQYGDYAALSIQAVNLHPEIKLLLGKLKFRYSLGQNVLDHSLEVSHLMGMMASELGLDVFLAKRIGLLHDMGKAVSHEIEGTHALIGYDLALKYGESKFVANGIGCHHQEMEPICLEAALCSAADALSASRPGARALPVETYFKRLKQLENMALEFSGIDKVHIMQAGKEVRIFVLPDKIDDTGLIHLAKELTKRIEKELQYPGKIKVTAIREQRAVEYAV